MQDLLLLLFFCYYYLFQIKIIVFFFGIVIFQAVINAGLVPLIIDVLKVCGL